MVPIVLIGIVFVIILIAGHELGHFIAAKGFGLRVDEFGIGFPPKIYSRKKGETKYSINALPFGGFVRIHGESTKEEEGLEDPGRSFVHQPAWKRVAIILAGVFMNFLIGWIAFSVVFTAGIPTRVFIEDVSPGSPAAEAGIKAGELLVGYSSSEEFVMVVNENIGDEIVVNGKYVVPREDFPEGEGPLGVVLLEGGSEKQGFGRSTILGLTEASKTTGLIAKSFGNVIKGLFTGNFEVAGQVSGPVGVFKILGDTAELGVVSLVQFLGLISLNLVVINMIPFPALDGGRFLFIVVEKLIGRRIDRKFEAIVNGIGILLLLSIMVIVTARDIIKIL